MNKSVTIGDSLKVEVLRFGETAVPEQGTNTSIKEGTIHVGAGWYEPYWDTLFTRIQRIYGFLRE